jgi:hypothetical protein
MPFSRDFCYHIMAKNDVFGKPPLLIYVVGRGDNWSIARGDDPSFMATEHQTHAWIYYVVSLWFIGNPNCTHVDIFANHLFTKTETVKKISRDDFLESYRVEITTVEEITETVETMEVIDYY